VTEPVLVSVTVALRWSSSLVIVGWESWRLESVKEVYDKPWLKDNEGDVIAREKKTGTNPKGKIGWTLRY
jgi:hypothetical protein